VLKSSSITAVAAAVLALMFLTGCAGGGSGSGNRSETSAESSHGDAGESSGGGTGESSAGTGSSYCKAVKDNVNSLQTADELETTEAYEKAAQAFRSIAEVAPASVGKDWTKLADLASAVLTALDAAHLRFEDIRDYKKWAEVPRAEQWPIKDAIGMFIIATAERKAVVKNVKDECGIVLS
jgi:hypothetical protein